MAFRNCKIIPLKRFAGVISSIGERSNDSQGTICYQNKEQEDLLKSKPSIVVGVVELEKFRHPLSDAVDCVIQGFLFHTTTMMFFFHGYLGKAK